MPLICIGPVCVPFTALLPVILYLGRPIWNRLSPETQQSISTRWNAFQDWMQINVWDKIGWKAKKETKAAPKAPSGTDAPTPEGMRSKLGGVVGLHTDAEWEAALALTKQSETAMVVDFTATWCAASALPCHVGSTCVEVPSFLRAQVWAVPEDRALLRIPRHQAQLDALRQGTPPTRAIVGAALTHARHDRTGSRSLRPAARPHRTLRNLRPPGVRAHPPRACPRSTSTSSRTSRKERASRRCRHSRSRCGGGGTARLPFPRPTSRMSRFASCPLPATAH